MTNARQAACGDVHFRGNCHVHLRGVLFSIKYTTWDRRKCSLFTVEGCSPKTNRVISPIVKYTEKMGPGKSVHYKGVFTNQGCSL